MIDSNPVLSYPPRFLTYLETKNQEKRATAPTALVLQGDSPEHKFSTAADRALINGIAETHRIALKAISEAATFGEKIREIASLFGRKIDMLIIFTHGDAQTLYFSSNPQTGEYSASTLDENDYSPLSPEAPIFLLSCLTGQDLAQKMADRVQHTVFSTPFYFCPLLSCWVREKEENLTLVSYTDDRNGLQRMRQFRPNKPSQSMYWYDKTLLAQSFLKQDQWLQEEAVLGDSDAQYLLGYLYLKEYSKIDPAFEQKAKRLLSLAANQDHAQAQYKLGLIYLNGNLGVTISKTSAFYWMKRAALNDYDEGLFQIGTLYESGFDDVAASDEKALKYYSLAANKQNADALYKIGVFYEQGRGGLPQSNEKAKECYLLAMKKEHIPAIRALIAMVFFQSPKIETLEREKIAEQEKTE